MDYVRFYSFVRPFIQAISIAPLRVHYYSEALPSQQGYYVGVSRRSVTEALPNPSITYRLILTSEYPIRSQELWVRRIDAYGTSIRQRGDADGN